MTSATYNGSTTTYSYNALGQRVSRVGTNVPRGPLYQYYDAFGNLAMQANTVTTTEDYFPPVAGRNYVEYSHATLYLHTNPLGSVGTTTDADGNWTSSEIYDPWGQRWGYTGTLYAERFADLHKRDAESGLDPTPNRMFTSSYGRWLSPDPLAGDITNPQSLNRYAYVGNNPLSFIDPMGLDSIGVDPCGNHPYKAVCGGDAASSEAACMQAGYNGQQVDTSAESLILKPCGFSRP